jgi:hypothetical protein
MVDSPSPLKQMTTLWKYFAGLAPQIYKYFGHIDEKRSA